MCTAHGEQFWIDALAITHEKHEREAVIADRHCELEPAAVILQPAEGKHETFRSEALAVEWIDQGGKAISSTMALSVSPTSISTTWVRSRKPLLVHSWTRLVSRFLSGGSVTMRGALAIAAGLSNVCMVVPFPDIKKVPRRTLLSRSVAEDFLRLDFVGDVHSAKLQQVRINAR